jgi:L-fuconolactonase
LTALEQRRRVFETAQYPNVYLKLPGLGELVPRPELMPVLERLPQSGPRTAPEARPGTGSMPVYGTESATSIDEIELALKLFGADRLLWGSDFPVVSSREGYANALDWARRAVATAMPGAEENVFGGTARRIFKLN